MEEQAKKKTGKRIWLVVLILSCLCLAVSLTFLWSYFRQPKEDGNLRSAVKTSSVESETEKEPVQIPIDFEELQRRSPDAYAWITITPAGKKERPIVDYPVVQHPTEPSFYLTHSAEKKNSRSGAIYTQLYNTTDFSDYNTVIYGHNMLNGTMFGQLKKYKNKGFFDKHREIVVYMPGRMLKYTVFAAYVWNDDHLLLNFDFGDPLVRASYWSQILSQRNINCIIAKDTMVTADDHVITLSTCTSKSNQRYLVQAVLTYDSDEE